MHIRQWVKDEHTIEQTDNQFLKERTHTTYMFTSCSREVTNGVGMFTSVMSMFDLVQCVPRMEYPDVIYRRNYQYGP